MSLIHEVFAWGVKIRNPQKQVFVYLARMAARETQEACLSVHRIAEDCGVSESTVRKCYADLVKAGYMSHVGRPVGHLHYRLTADWQVCG